MKHTSLTLSKRGIRAVVVDKQNDFCHPDGSFGNTAKNDPTRGIASIQKASGNISVLVDTLRTNNVPICWIAANYSKGQFTDYPDPLLCVIDSSVTNPKSGSASPDWRVQIYEDIPHGGEPIFKKDTSEHTGHFGGKPNGLIQWLGDGSRILLVGFTTDNCFKGAVMTLSQANYGLIIPEDCTAVRDHKTDSKLRKMEEWATWSNIIIVPSHADLRFEG
ncbi:MAG: isochorismatase family protein [Candidatus Micrarchaeota archaeon]